MSKPTAIVLISLLPCLGWAADSGKISPTEKTLYEDSIRSTKQSIARETLDAFYHDALDYYNDYRYDEALQLLDKIYSIDPHYENVSKLRDTIRKKQQSSVAQSALITVKDLMKQGDKAEQAGQRVPAISYWKQALEIDPKYAPAIKKIQDVNQAMAKKEFEAGYIHYHHNEMDDALESWSNAIALDPTYKQKGLLLLMSKIEQQVRRDRVARLAAQGFEQSQEGRLEEALQTYDELLKLEPRHEEARRMSSKIKIQIGQTALGASQAALSGRDYPTAIQQADKAIQYGYAISRSSAVKVEAEHALQLSKLPKPAKPRKPAKPTPAVSPSSATVQAPPAFPAAPANPEEAMTHYRQGIAAIRKKDYHLAMDELDVASKLDPSNERIYMARERARQAWNAANTDRAAP
jgi:tetratricopeptide (TPR) repeat protein